MTRTTHRSTAGKKLYAKRAKDGKFTDIQTHKRSSRADQRVTTVAEATRVFIREVKPLLASWTGWAHTAKAEAALKALNAATRAAAKRKRGKV